MSDGLDLDTKAYSLKNFIRRMDEVRERQAADYGPRRGVGHPEQKVSAPSFAIATQYWVSLSRSKLAFASLNSRICDSDGSLRHRSICAVVVGISQPIYRDEAGGSPPQTVYALDGPCAPG